MPPSALENGAKQRRGTGEALRGCEHPVGDDHIVGAGHQRDAARVGVGEHRGPHRNPLRGIEPMAADHIGDPLHGAKLQNAKPDVRILCGRSRSATGEPCQDACRKGEPIPPGQAGLGPSAEVVCLCLMLNRHA